MSVAGITYGRGLLCEEELGPGATSHMAVLSPLQDIMTSLQPIHEVTEALHDDAATLHDVTTL